MTSECKNIADFPKLSRYRNDPGFVELFPDWLDGSFKPRDETVPVEESMKDSVHLQLEKLFQLSGEEHLEDLRALFGGSEEITTSKGRLELNLDGGISSQGAFGCKISYTTKEGPLKKLIPMILIKHVPSFGASDVFESLLENQAEIIIRTISQLQKDMKQAGAHKGMVTDYSSTFLVTQHVLNPSSIHYKARYNVKCVSWSDPKAFLILSEFVIIDKRFFWERRRALAMSRTESLMGHSKVPEFIMRDERDIWTKARDPERPKKSRKSRKNAIGGLSMDEIVTTIAKGLVPRLELQKSDKGKQSQASSLISASPTNKENVES